MVVKSSDKTTAKIYYGDGTPLMVFSDEKGKKRNFESLFEPINLLVKMDWRLIDSLLCSSV